jgi:hypothetical protein
MFKLLALGAIATTLAACSTSSSARQAENLANNVQAVEQNRILSVIAEKDLAVPHGAQNLVSFAKFHAQDNLYDRNGTKLLIPRNAIVTGVYTNDGINCAIEWKAVYANEADYRKTYGALTLEKEAIPSRCDPMHGVKEGERATITFLGGQYQD